jgi:CheY-like chemotaxis protein
VSARGRVLVADDDEAMRTTVAFTLIDDGYDVVEVASGNEVLQLLELREPARVHTGSFDLLLMDVRMPGLSGLDTVRRLRRLEAPPPVILMTAFASPETRDQADALRVPLLSKPFALADLLRTAGDVLRASKNGRV